MPPVGGQWGGPLADEARGQAQNTRPFVQEDGNVDVFQAYMPPVNTPPPKQGPAPDPDDRARRALLTIENKLRTEFSSLHEQVAETIQSRVNQKLMYALAGALGITLVILLIYFIARSK